MLGNSQEKILILCFKTDPPLSPGPLQTSPAVPNPVLLDTHSDRCMALCDLADLGKWGQA